MVYQRLFQEEKQIGIIYHFTNFDNLYSILKSGKLKGNKDILERDKEKYKTHNFGENKYSYSFTRKRDLTEFGTIRITLNGSKLSQKYKIFPIGDKNKYDLGEERINSKYSELDIIDSIISVNITPSKINNILNKDENYLLDNLNEIKKICLDNNINLTNYKINEYKKFKEEIKKPNAI